MRQNILVVDDDRNLLHMIQGRLEKYDGKFSVLIAADGQEAAEKLRLQPVSLIVTDLKMPRVDGFKLLAHVFTHYPDVPVFVMTGYGTPKLQEKALTGGAVDFIQKPFMVEDLAQGILKTLRKQSEGGVLRGFSIGIFTQLIEADAKTCTIRVFNRRSGEQGVLFFHNGELMDARLTRAGGLQAAHSILSWEDVSFSIQNTCPMLEKRIGGDLQAILLEAMRRKDQESVAGNG